MVKRVGLMTFVPSTMQYAHPSLVMHLQVLFKQILLHGSVPASFGIGVTIPLLKDKTGNVNDVDNCRGILPIISHIQII